ncbi:MAG: hypothetical protein EBW05_13065, partial [Betaproteobacteria bacterium]|nr:hypothetical protein [Betaproteobacteria bacterium]
RIGVGDAQTFDMQTTIERNLFYRSIWRTNLTSGGEPEIISNKSKNNKILNNTFNRGFMKGLRSQVTRYYLQPHAQQAANQTHHLLHFKPRIS